MLVMSPDTLRRLTNCRLLLVLLLLTVHRLEFPTLVLKTHYTASQINNSKRAVMLYSVYRSRRIRSLSRVANSSMQAYCAANKSRNRYDTIRQKSLTWAKKISMVSLIQHTQPETNKKPSCRQDSRPYCQKLQGSRDLGHAQATFWENYLCACSALPIQSRVSNLTSLAQVVLKICSIVCQKLQVSRDLGHAVFKSYMRNRLVPK